MTRFVSEVFSPDRRRSILTDLHEFANQVADHGRWNSLSQVLLKIASPGVPDFYQGTETWNLTLVDPDNRQPVDFAALSTALAALQSDLSAMGPGSLSTEVIDRWLEDELTDEASVLDQLLRTRADGRIKMFVTAVGLRSRARFPQLFTGGEYRPLEVTGTSAESVIAFARRHQNRWAVVMAPRWTVRVVGFGGPPPLGELWRDTAVQLPAELAGCELRDAFSRRSWSSSDAVWPLSQALRSFPLAMGLAETPA